MPPPPAPRGLMINGSAYLCEMSVSEADATDPASDEAGGDEVQYQKRLRQSSRRNVLRN